MFEHRRQPLLPRAAFHLRVLRHTSLAAGVIAASLLLGACGYHWIEGLPWLDALLNASMILTGMGPVNVMHTAAGKLFAAAYALFSGVVFLSLSALMVAPFLHRLMHRFHLADDEEDRADRRP